MRYNTTAKEYYSPMKSYLKDKAQDAWTQVAQ